MKNKESVLYFGLWSLIFMAAAFLVPGESFMVVAGEAEQTTSYDASDIKRGALLYDNWPKLSDNEFTRSHPLYPDSAKKSGTTTWRCKECHGWDYIGKNGRYSKGSHYTGIDGLYDSRTKTPNYLFERLTNTEGDHDFGHFLDENDIWALVRFIREGQRSFRDVIDADGKTLGSAVTGGRLYQDHCSSCHGKDGNRLDFKPNKEGVQGIAWLAVENPQESIHKIRWGHPGSIMPSMVVDGKLSEQQAIDILTYSQSLDGK